MTKEHKPSAGQKPAAVLLTLAAILVPLLPLFFWLRESLSLMPSPVETPSFGLYLLARAFALIGFVLMFYQFILTARLPFLEKLFQRSRLVKRHRLLGRIGFSLILLHGVILLVQDLSLYSAKTLGLIALILLTITVAAASLAKPLKLSVKTWRTVHLAAYVVFPLAFIHALSLGSTVLGYRPVYWLFVLLSVIYFLILLRRIVRGIRKTG
ncbi:MAG: ferric reductase-like transmembrane domain-containing protein [Spirochaetales bacterium]|nr:ferric reductase-like transmembrane domain-containing protein [Spirochaetales bacterium]